LRGGDGEEHWAFASARIPAELVADGPALFHLPKLVAACQRQRTAVWSRLPIPPKRNSVLSDLIEDEPTGVSWSDGTYTDRLPAMMAPVHQAKVGAAKRAGKRMVGALYWRILVEADGKKVQRAEVRFDDVAGCLRVPIGGSSRQTT
jgi:DNA (cytosine-5)-methyltransferase 1